MQNLKSRNKHRLSETDHIKGDDDETVDDDIYNGPAGGL